MRSFDAQNLVELSRASLRARGLRAAPGLVGRALFTAAHQALWSCEADAPPARGAVLIVGHQRSGTTWLHRMLCQHPAAAGLTLLEQVLPSGLTHRLLPPPAWVDRAQDRLFGPTDDLHRIRLQEIEEDEFVLWAGTRAAMNAHDRPWPQGGAPRIGIDEAGLNFYAQVVARATRRSQRRHVGKSPQLGRHIPALRRWLPGLRVIHLVRDPLACVPSRLSLIRAVWRRRVPGFTDLRADQVEALWANSRALLLEPVGRADLVLRYTDLVRDPVGTVVATHAALGLEPWPTFALTDLAVTPRTGHTPHRYQLAEFGLDPERLRAELRPLYDSVPGL